MKQQLFTLLVSASFLSMVKPAFAETPVTGNSDQELQKVAAQTAALESEVTTLRKEIRQLKASQRYARTTTRQSESVENTAPGYAPVRVPTGSTESKTILPAVRNSPITYLSGTPVVIAPYIGKHNAFNALDLVVNYSTYNLDLNLLQLRQQMNKQYTDACLPLPQSPMLMLSGKIEGQAGYLSPYNHAYSTSKIDLSSAELDVIPTIGQWASGYFSLSYDNSPTANRALVDNSRVRVKRGFLTFGNLDRFPLYVTMGQIDLPFSDYGNYFISDILPQDIFLTRARTVLLGYQGASGQGPYAQIFAFNGDTNTNRNNNINDVGANAGFKFTQGNYNGDLGVSGIANVADSLPMQETGLPYPLFSGFSGPVFNPAGNTDAETLKRQVPGIAIHGALGMGHFGVLGRYVEATSAFAPQDLMFDNHGARPHSFDAEVYYNFHMFAKPSVITAGYDKSWEALALGVPQQRYLAAVMTSIWKDTIQEIEYRHDINYGTSDSSSGAGTPAQFSKGGSSNAVTLQVGVYF
jgi:hypothetical protein